MNDAIQYMAEVSTKNDGEFIPTIMFIGTEQQCLDMVQKKVGDIQWMCSTMWITYDIGERLNVGSHHTAQTVFLNLNCDNEREHLFIVRPYKQLT